MSDGSGGAVIIYILILAVILGWGLNIYNLATTKTLTGMSLLRVIGVFAFPLGCILGFIGNSEDVTNNTKEKQ